MNCCQLRFNFAFSFNLRRYTWGDVSGSDAGADAAGAHGSAVRTLAGLFRHGV
jgi:hypothetical protein